MELKETLEKLSAFAKSQREIYDSLSMNAQQAKTAGGGKYFAGCAAGYGDMEVRINRLLESLPPLAGQAKTGPENPCEECKKRVKVFTCA